MSVALKSAVPARRRLVRAAITAGCVALLFFVALELMRRSKPEFMPAGDAMTYPAVISGVWVTGFEESSFFPDEEAIPDRNDPRRYRVELIVGSHRAMALRRGAPERGYAAFRLTFLGRRTRYPFAIDCEGGRNYYFIPDWILRARYLGPMPDPDLPVRQPGPYRPFKRSGDGGKIRELEDRALANCGWVRGRS
ncbi:MAG TPA: hypothetical protein VF079_11580 [Sphingomicrobium sp.]